MICAALTPSSAARSAAPVMNRIGSAGARRLGASSRCGGDVGAAPACDRPATALEQLERSTAAAGLQHGVAELTQGGSGELAHGLVVIDQDQTAAGLGGRTGTRRGSPDRGSRQK